MKPIGRILAAVLAVAFASTIVDTGSEARETSGLRQSRQVKKSRPRHRLVRREAAPAPSYAPSAAYAGPPAGVPYGGPGRAYFENPVAGAAPDRAESRSPEGP
jgi:hypothetical protein